MSGSTDQGWLAAYDRVTAPLRRHDGELAGRLRAWVVAGEGDLKSLVTSLREIARNPYASGVPGGDLLRTGEGNLRALVVDLPAMPLPTAARCLLALGWADPHADFERPTSPLGKAAFLGLVLSGTDYTFQDEIRRGVEIPLDLGLLARVLETLQVAPVVLLVAAHGALATGSGRYGGLRHMTSMRGYVSFVEAHAGALRELLALPDTAARLAALRLAEPLPDPVLQQFAAQVVAAATAADEQVVWAAEPLARRCAGAAAEPLRRLATEGAPGTRLRALRLLRHGVGSEEDRAWAAHRAAADPAASVRALIDETVAPGTFARRLAPVLVAGDLAAARELLDSLSGDELVEARDWFRRSAWWWSSPPVGRHAGQDHDEVFDTSHRAQWIVSMCTVRLAGPRTAAGRMNWQVHWDYQQNEGEAAFVHLLWDADPAWVAEFVDVAGCARLGSVQRNTNGALSRVLRAVAVHHATPCPDGETFLKAWLAGAPRGATLADRLEIDPLMPDLLLHYLASGHCGDCPDLPDAVAELVRRGAVSRAAVLERVVAALTAPQRPKGQRVLALMLPALGAEAAEVPGGLTYVLGVLATCHGTVVPPLLPYALALVARSEDLAALTDVVLSRPEKGPRSTLLAALKDRSTVDAVGVPAARQALEALAATDDAAFAARVRKVLSGLGPVAPTEETPAATVSLGLWDLVPRPPDAGGDGRAWWGNQAPRWEDALDSRYSYPEEQRFWAVEATLAELAGRGGRRSYVAELVAAVELRVAEQRLSTSQLSRALEDLFLAGGLGQLWTTAIEVCAAACGAAKRPAGLADLLRLVARYAPETPGPVDVPPELAALALSSGRTKAVTEARRLVAELTRLPEPEALAAIGSTEPSRPEPRGLWEAMTPPSTPHPSEVRLAGQPVVGTADLNGLRNVVRADAATRFPSDGWLVAPDLALAATLRGVRQDGVDAVRAALRGIERPGEPEDVFLAIDCWVAGCLDRSAFWRVARGPLTSWRDVIDQWRDVGLDGAEVESQRRAVPAFAHRLASSDGTAALLLPHTLETATARFAFLRAAELLLLVEAGVPFLAEPTWADGTLEVDDLLARLHRAAAQRDRLVGPLDLVQALHRLRPADPRRAAEVPDGLRTAAAFTDPEGVESSDASELVRSWLAGGGLPRLEVAVTEDSRWSTSTVSPVPFTRLAALPAELGDDPWCPGANPAMLRMVPQWPERWARRAFATVALAQRVPDHAREAPGLPLHDRLLAELTPEYNRTHFEVVTQLVDLARRERLNPALAAEAALGRHQAGTLDLTLLVKALQRAFAPDSFRGIWPSALAIADALCGVDRRPPGLPALLRLLAGSAHEVPADALPALPAGVVALAESRGSTQAHEAARLLVAALPGVHPR